MGDIPQNEEAQKERVMRPLYVSQTSSYSPPKKRCVWVRKAWFKRTIPERVLFVLLVIAFIIIFALSIAVHVYKQREVLDVCITKDCVTTAGFMLNSIDFSAEPCADFYEFACGNFIDQALVPDKSTVRDFTIEPPSVSIFSIKQEAFLARLKAMMEEPYNMTDPNSLWKAKTLYASCTNTDRIEELDSKPLLEVMEGFGGWPVVKGPDWEEEHFNWEEVLHKFYTKGMTTALFFEVHVRQDEKRPDDNVIRLEIPELSFPIEYDKEYPAHLMNDSRVITYYHYIVNASVALGANRTRAEEELRKLVEFEAAVAQLMSRDSLTNGVRLPISHLNTLVPQLDWIEFFGNVMPDKLSNSQMLFIQAPDYLRNVLDLVNSSPKRLIADFMMWRLVKENLIHLSQPYQDLVHEFDVLAESDSPRWFTCLTTVWDNSLTPAAVYIRRYMNPDDKEKVEEIFSAIKEEVKDVIKNLDNIKDRKRQEALEILSSIKHNVFPDEFLDDTVLDNYYSELTISSDEYLQNLFKVKKFSRDAELREIKRHSQHPHWAVGHYPLAVNLYYTGRAANVIEIPFNMLVGFNFESDRPRYINYATLGTYLGSQMIFTFPEDIRDVMFPERDKCTAVQIVNKVVPGVPHATVEVIGAIRLVYKAYEKWVSNNGDEDGLPGLPFTPQQMFWITDATVACGKHEEETGNQEYVKSRVNGPMSNLEEFSNDFECELGSEMNPPEKCHLW